MVVVLKICEVVTSGTSRFYLEAFSETTSQILYTINLDQDPTTPQCPQSKLIPCSLYRPPLALDPLKLMKSFGTNSTECSTHGFVKEALQICHTRPRLSCHSFFCTCVSRHLRVSVEGSILQAQDPINW